MQRGGFANESGREVFAVGTDPATMVSALYVLLGFGLILTNGSIAATILIFKRLRQKKEYIAFAGLAIVELIVGLATTEAGIYRLIIKFKSDLQLIRRSQCLWVPHTFLFAFAPPLLPLMFCVVSLDRLVAVLLPFRYLTMGVTCTVWLIWLCFAGTFSVALVAVARLHNLDTTMADAAPSCVTFVVIGKGFHTYVNLARLIFALASVLIYMMVPAKFYYRRQRKMNITVGISSALTLVLFICPIALSLVNYHYRIVDAAPEQIETYIWLFNCTNSLLSAPIYLLRHLDLRRGLAFLFKCQLSEQPTRKLGYAGVPNTPRLTTKNQSPPYQMSKNPSPTEGTLNGRITTAV